MNSIDKLDIFKLGYLDKEIDPNIDMIEEINKLRKEKNAVILAHYYQEAEIQDIADYVGDSLALSQEAAKTNADIILFSGVHFMGETAKILSYNKKVIVPDLKAGCSLADSCTSEEFAEFRKQYPGHIVVSYVNTTAEIKALSDIICTSSNAIEILKSIDKSKKIIFAPDRNLGNYISSITGREMVIWDGACHVHEEFSLERIMDLKKEHKEAKIIAHPECEKPILIVADHIGSTASLLNFTKNDDGKKYIVATEAGIIHQMKKINPEKEFIPAPPKDSSCGCGNCNFMKLNTMGKIYNALKYEIPEIIIEKELRNKAYLPIKKMLEISEKAGLIK